MIRMLLHNSRATVKGGAGEVLNLVAADTEAASKVFAGVISLTIQPLEIVGPTGLLYYLMGYGCFGGLATVLLSLMVSQIVSMSLETKLVEKGEVADQRCQLLQETLKGIKVVRLSAWEQRLTEALKAVRMEESEHGFWCNARAALLHISGNNCVDCIAVAVLAIYTLPALMDEQLTPSLTFSMWVVLSILHGKIFRFPVACREASKAFAALRRISSFLAATTPPEFRHTTTAGAALKVSDLIASWEETPSSAAEEGTAPCWDGRGRDLIQSDKNLEMRTTSSSKESLPSLSDHYSSGGGFVLRVTSFELDQNQLCGVCGPVASGKSALLHGILGELHTHQGKINVNRSSVGYVPQIPIVFDGTVKENIILGIPYDEGRFKWVCSAVCLDTDLALFLKGSDTPVSGLVLSGGQQARLGIARCLYARPRLALLDAVLSALDATVAAHVFHEALELGLGESCRVLVTNDVNLLQKCHVVCRMEQGQLTRVNDDDDVSLVLVESSEMSGSSLKDGLDEEAIVANIPMEPEDLYDVPLDAVATQVIQAAGGPGYLLPIEALQLIECFVIEIGVIILGMWTDIDHTSDQQAREYNLLYGSSVLIALFFAIVRQTLWVYAVTSANQSLHTDLLTSVRRAPLISFTEVSTGKLIRMFSHTIGLLDSDAFPNLEYFQHGFCWMIAVITVCTYYTRFFLCVLMAMLTLAYFTVMAISTDYLALPVHIAESQARTLEKMGEAQHGAVVLRAYSQVDVYIEQHSALLDRQVETSHNLLIGSCWLELRCALIGTFGYVAAAIIVVFSMDHFSAGDAGVVLVNLAFLSLLCVMLLENAIKIRETAQSRMACTNYVEAMATQPLVDTKVVVDEKPGCAAEELEELWPSRGDLMVRNLMLRYSPGAPLVLSGISFHLPPGARAGCVGRTGAGKSSIIAAITRLVEPCGGEILIDGVDVLRIPEPEMLRQRLGTMSQDNLLFTGSVRYNLDPWGSHADEKLSVALAEVGLSIALDSEIKTMGTTKLSVGQRHLLSVARLLLSRPRVVLLDEPTAHLDPDSASRVLKTLWRVLPDSTILHVAHDLETIVEYQEVLVVDAGLIQEQGSPWELLQRTDGVFSKMVQSHGSQAAAALRQTAWASKESRAANATRSINTCGGMMAY